MRSSALADLPSAEFRLWLDRADDDPRLVYVARMYEHRNTYPIGRRTVRGQKSRGQACAVRDDIRSLVRLDLSIR